MKNDLSGKNAVITGASRGVGKAAALALAAEGVNLAVCARTLDALQDTVKEGLHEGVQIYAFAVDLNDPEQTVQFMRDAENALGGMDILINNAGIWLSGKCTDIPLEDWQNTMNVNLTAPFLTSQYFARSNIEKRRPGKIININSQAAFNGSTSGHVHYAASKAGLTAMTVSMARELGPSGITVNGIALGMVDTDLIRDAYFKNEAAYNARLPIGRLAEPEEIAGILVFMAGSGSDYLTGATVDASGGMLMR